MTTTDHGGLDWLLETLLAKTPGARHALVLSRDGLKLCLSSGLSVDRADQLAAIASGIQALAHGASMEFGDGSGGVRQSMTEFHGGILFIVEAGEGAHLAVVGEEYADAGIIGHHMNELVEQLGDRLLTDPRTAARTNSGLNTGINPGGRHGSSNGTGTGTGNAGGNASPDGTHGQRRA